MSAHSTLHECLRVRIAAVTSRTHTRHDLNQLIAVCHALAEAYLCGRHAGRTLASLQGYSCSDLAYDCIADIFQRNDTGDYVELSAYFNGFPARADAHETLIHLRRLVFSKTTQQIHRLYGQHDPALGRILRNVKNAARTSPHLREIERYGEPFLAPAHGDTLEHLPAIEHEMLLHDLLVHAPRNARIPGLMACVARSLLAQSSGARLVSHFDMATLARQWYAMDRQAEPDHDPVESQFLHDDTTRIVRASCRSVFRKMRSRYVGRNKISAEIFREACRAIEEFVLNRIVGDGGEEAPLFCRIRDRVPTMTEHEYRVVHRTRMEYLVRCAYDRAVHDLKHEYRGPRPEAY
jgi:hypothetical protein